MASDDQPIDPMGMETLPVPATPTAMVPAPGPIVVPAEVTPEEAAALQARTVELVAQLETSAGSKEMELVDTIGAIGIQAQRQAGSELQLLRVRVGDMLGSDETSGKVTKDLVDLRRALNDINPDNENDGPFQKLLDMLPFGKNVSDVLERIAIRYESVSKQVMVIEQRLDEGRLMLRRDNIELRKLYEQVESQQAPVRKNAYFGELLMEELRKLHERTTDAHKRDRAQNALYDVSIRVQDLRTIEEVNNQFFVSIEMTRENNTRLGQAVDRTLALATNTLMVGLAIQSALARQKRVLEATERTREFLGELIASNAAAIKQHTAEIGDVYKNPVIAIEKLTQAHNDLMEALNTADRLKTEGIESARQNIAKLSQLSSQLNEKIQGLPDRREAPGLEA